MAAHSLINPGPENTYYDKRRHEEMRLRPLGMYGIPKFFVNGFKTPKAVCPVCDRLLVWCSCEKS